MIEFRKATWVLASFVVLGLIAATASAGLLGTGHSYQGAEGSQDFSAIVTDGTLKGTLDFAVFQSADFASIFSGYTPTPGELVYAYQIHNTGTASISLSKLVLISGAPADLPGIFSGSGVSGQSPSSYYIGGGAVHWDFIDGHEVIPGGQSVGLAFSSIRKPMTRDITVITNGGGSVNVPNVTGPGTVAIPEPASLALLAAAAVVAGIAVARNRREDK